MERAFGPQKLGPDALAITPDELRDRLRHSRRPIKPISKNGILGYRLPTLLELRYSYDPGDIFVLYSDGVSSQFSQDAQIDIKQPPQRIADDILARYGKPIDDATVLVVKTSL